MLPLAKVREHDRPRRVPLSTCSLLKQHHLSRVVVDEAAQSIEASTLVPLPRPRRTFEFSLGMRSSYSLQLLLEHTTSSTSRCSCLCLSACENSNTKQRRSLACNIGCAQTYISDFLIRHIYPDGILQNAPEQTFPRTIESYVRMLTGRISVSTAPS